MIKNGDFTKVLNCECPHGCTSPDFTFDYSTSKTPMGKPNYTTSKCSGYFSNTKINCLKAYNENAVSIDVTYNQQLYGRTVERPAYTVMF